MSVYESIDAFKLAWVKELLLRSSGNGGVNFIMVHCMFAFYKRYKFYIFSPQIFSFSIFKSTSNGVSYLALINRFGGLKMRCSWDIRDSLLWAICEDLKFGKFFYSKIFVMCVYESIDAFKLAWVKELLLRSSGNGGVNFIMVHCMFAFYKRYKFYIFSPQICSFSIFKSTSNGVSYLALINRFGGLKMRCSWDIRDSCYERFVKIWNLASFFTRKSLWCLFMKASMRSNWPGLKNCSWGQVVTEAWILLWCIVSLRFTNDINSIFFPLKFSVFLFSNRRAMGSHILHS